MLRALFCTVLVTVLATGPLLAADGCPNCGSKNAVGTGVAAVCPDCGRATIFGLSIPLASALGSALAATAAGGLYLAARRLRSRRLAAVPGPA
jgi:hypothetical protein